MTANLIHAGLASLAVAFAMPALAQTSANQPTFTHGESKRCESLTGSAKEQCDREEATKTQGAPAEQDKPAAAGSSTTTFTHGESKRCEALSGAEKDECDKQEATKAAPSTR